MTIHRTGTALFLVLLLAACGRDAPVAPAPPAATLPAGSEADAPPTAASDTAALPELRYYQISDG